MGFPLPAFHIHPTDEDILKNILPRWSAGEDSDPSLMRKIKLYGSNKEPGKIYAELGIPEDYLGELYFLTLVKKKHCISGNDNNCMGRVAGNGSWTCQESIQMYDSVTNHFIGYKNIFSYQNKKRNLNLNSTWIMEEYTPPNSQDQDQFCAFCSIKRVTNGRKDKKNNPSLLRNKNKRPLLESEADVFRIKKQRWIFASYEPPIGTISMSLQRYSGVQIEAHHQPPSHICAQTIDEGTLCTSSISPPALSPGDSHGSKDKGNGKEPLLESTAETDLCVKTRGLTLTDTHPGSDGSSASHEDQSTLCTSSKSPPDKGKRLLLEESIAEADTYSNTSRSLTPTATYEGMNAGSTSYEPTTGTRLQLDNCALECVSQHEVLHHQPTTAALSPSDPEEPLHHCGTSRVPGQASVPE